MSILDLIVEMRGEIPACCDFCGALFTEANYPTPEEAGEWACIECVKLWESKYGDV